MDNRISTFRSDVVGVQTTPRPTPTPARVQFSEVLAGGAQALVRGAQAALRVLPGSPLMAVALRGGPGGSTNTTLDVPVSGAAASNLPLSATPEGPGGASSVPGVATTSGASDGGLESSIAQSQQLNVYYLQVQEEVNAQNRTFTALSNVLEVEHNTAKSAIGNIH